MGNMVDFNVFPCADYDQHHRIFFTDELIDNTQSGPAQLDLEEAGQLRMIFVSQTLTVSALCIRQRIGTYFFDGLLTRIL